MNHEICSLVQIAGLGLGRLFPDVSLSPHMSVNRITLKSNEKRPRLAIMQSDLCWRKLCLKAIISACVVGLITGITVVLFNIAVHEIRDLCWDGFPSRGASWLREEAIGVKWQRVILVPACGGLLVSFLNTLRASLEGSKSIERNWKSSLKSVLGPVLKTLAACVTLGTGNSLGPEGPSVDIGTSVARGVGALYDKGSRKKLSLKAAGISSVTGEAEATGGWDTVVSQSNGDEDAAGTKDDGGFAVVGSEGGGILTGGSPNS